MFLAKPFAELKERQILESPAWYTPYTPYQPEIAQGLRMAYLITTVS